MNKIALIDESKKESLRKLIYGIRYGRKFKKLNIDENFANTLMCRDEKEILKLIGKSKNQEEFAKNIREYLKSEEFNGYANALLIGNITGKYVFNDFYYKSLKGLNIDAFSKENQDLLVELKSHFKEYVIDNNKRKNMFAQKLNDGKSNVRDLSSDINESEITEDFDRALNGDGTNNGASKGKVVTEYLMKTIGTYSKEDIKNNFDFVLYDINNTDNNKNNNKDLEDRRKKYLMHSNLSNNQLRKIDQLGILKQRLQSINSQESEQLLARLNSIENGLDEHINELEDIYGDYEALYRQDLISKLYVPKKDITIIENYKDMKPQLIHQFIRSPEKFRDLEIKKITEKIISERTNGNDNKELSAEEQEKLNQMMNQVDANLNQYEINYTTDGRGTSYTDSTGLDRYHSDTSNQISASIFEGKEFINSSAVGIIGVGFNEETLTSEAIAVSSNTYKTTNKGINNLEYDEKNEFEEMSSPFSELIKSRGKSEVVMHRRGMDFDTKASYIFATIDSSDENLTKGIMEQIEHVKEKEGLKVVIYDINKIRESMEQAKQEQNKDEEKER